MSTKTATKTVAASTKKAAPAAPKAPTKAELAKRSASTSRLGAAGGNVQATPTGLTVLITASQPVKADSVVDAALSGSVRFVKVRANGTKRSWPVLNPGSPAHETATAWAKAQAGGASVAAIAKGANVSVPTVRRGLTALAFTGALVNSTKATQANLAKVANAAFQAKEAKKAVVPAAEAPAEDEPRLTEQGKSDKEFEEATDH